MGSGQSSSPSTSISISRIDDNILNQRQEQEQQLNNPDITTMDYPTNTNPASPSNSNQQATDQTTISNLSNPPSRPYPMERTDTTNTIAHANDEQPVVVSDSSGRILRQRSDASIGNNEPDTPITQSQSHSQQQQQQPQPVQQPQQQQQQQPITPAQVSRSRSTGSRLPTSPVRKGSSKDVHHITAHSGSATPTVCLNPAKEANDRLDTQVEVRVYPCNNNSGNGKKKFSQFSVKPEGVIIQGTNRHRNSSNDIGTEYAQHVGRKLERYELNDTRACQLLVTTHAKSFWVVPAPEAFSRHSGTCRLLGDRKHPLASHVLSVGDFLRVGSVGVVVIETHDGEENQILSEEKIQKIMRDTTNGNGGFSDIGETDGENSEDELDNMPNLSGADAPVCYMCFDDENSSDNPLITPCKCRGDTRYVHVNCLRKWHTAEADNQICFLSSVDATCSVCKSTFKSDFRLKDGRLVKLFKSSLEPPYVSLLVATKHEMAQRLYNTRFQLSFSTILKADGKNATRPLQLGRSSGSDMVLDYRTVSARHATVRFKNGQFIFTDAASSNGSYLYLRRPVELTPSQPVQFRLGRSMISMKVVNKWNRRLLRAVRRSGGNSSSVAVDSIPDGVGAGRGGVLGDDLSVGSSDNDVRVTNGKDGTFTRNLPRRTRESIMKALPKAGMMSQQSGHHLDLLHALAYPKKHAMDMAVNERKLGVTLPNGEDVNKRDVRNLTNQMAGVSIVNQEEKS